MLSYMGSSTTITIRLDEDLKREIEKAAQADDRNMTDFLLRAAKARMASQCASCGRSDTPSALPPGFTPAFDAFLAEIRDKWPRTPILLMTAGAGQAIVHRGLLKLRNEYEDARGFVVLWVEGIYRDMPLTVPVPRGTIIGWSFDQDGGQYERLTELGYLDGNAMVRRQIAARTGAL